MRLLIDSLVEAFPQKTFEQAPGLEKAVDSFLEQVRSVANYKMGTIQVSIELEKGARYWRLAAVETDITTGKKTGSSAYGFIDSTNGNILKASSAKAPHPTPRGNVFDSPEQRAKAFNQYGITYLRQ